ncbi:class I SAM-dependent methyltransferase [Seongchinamella unica]|uniref:Class I SAM-dependent methyltransferase n=1 Tax=Seongchinamella unica TaxID=2547392 RepID=A0A4R5LNB8_9GAMM|nr:class I SAM-dependent methyltransferase [Seongchinamella unica]TDG11805.1 class I SAM-dependent methyltransferase [Seongchinamella unica]
MESNSKAVELYTLRSRSYLRFINAVAYPQGISAYFQQSPHLEEDMRVLDAGCGTGIATLAVRKAMLARGIQPGNINGFDITPKMLATFRSNLRKQAIGGIEVVQADVLELGTLPDSWRSYDLIISAAMMEYISPERLVEALSGLRSLLGDTGTLVLFITRRNWLTRLLIGKWWHANCYRHSELEAYLHRAGFPRITFGSFPFPYKHLSVWGYIVEASQVSTCSLADERALPV